MRLEIIYDKLNKDLQAIFEGDPAAQNRREIIRSYPGFYAIAAYRVAYELFKLNIEDLPRIISEHAHSKTGIDIHPGAKIDDYFCIDHGTGVAERTKRLRAGELRPTRPTPQSLAANFRTRTCAETGGCFQAKLDTVFARRSRKSLSVGIGNNEFNAL